MMRATKRLERNIVGAFVFRAAETASRFFAGLSSAKTAARIHIAATTEELNRSCRNLK